MPNQIINLTEINQLILTLKKNSTEKDYSKDFCEAIFLSKF